ncbi:HET domain-containing protein [Fusarium falciforme]|uniref:HET domain-containing protein n=1 Tax=Fusarium falciforme TaxID=195108 RepID=UPI0022FFF0E5|nr:HET domain-containing protein [Fusarium falciforme]WAO96693.1 HET domain-containing protein [Fusarium falciforme]
MSSPTSAPQKPSLYANLHMSGRQIRLLQITSTKPEIACRLEVVSLEDEPAYSALSYAWGDPAITKSVLVNGERVNVTTNLASALEHAPKHLEDANVAPKLWADAICINQDDPNEKNHQVPFMKDIYSQAEIVICWLGPPIDQVHRGLDWIGVIARECSFADDDDELQDAFDTLNLQKGSEKKDFGSTESLTKSQDANTRVNEALASYQKRLQQYNERQCLIHKSPNLAWIFKYPSFYEGIDEGAGGASDLLGTFAPPYWTRVWIFQELALAKKPIFACGTRSISLASLDHLARWTQWLTSDPTIVRPQVIDPRQWEGLKHDAPQVTLYHHA